MGWDLINVHFPMLNSHLRKRFGFPPMRIEHWELNIDQIRFFLA
jgi:hypothetical protein